ncbi:MAG: hypothetical protein ACLUFV_05390 [Acutalibacteraceae bacterium]
MNQLRILAFLRGAGRGHPPRVGIHRGGRGRDQARFAVPMHFGTAGLRSVMAAGISRMNVYTVAQTTQALPPRLPARRTDARRGHCLRQPQQLDAFAETAAEVLAGNGVKVYI